MNWRGLVLFALMYGDCWGVWFGKSIGKFTSLMNTVWKDAACGSIMKVEPAEEGGG